ncbi:DUF2807 domain-containing protein [Flammeovirga sp. MY04]|uniref:GIN domain-containing protein n=1 Tax=Flammeovirga sp. MY04 TaxID=1191459 RepID=UPI0008061383|nr:DUF2807 domain-containing protein [Flammeovirga sp. MY04]ANQ50352.1 DUF2807 domain-containing protein [Flammeovirga sp. MY04]
MLVIFSFACKKEKGEGPIISKELSISTFKKVNNSVATEILIEYGTEQSVTVDAEQNVLNALNTAVSDSTWNISLRTTIRDYTLKVKIVTPEIDAFITSGSTPVTISGPHSSNGDFAITASGSSIIEVDGMNAIVGDITLEASGSTTMNLNGFDARSLSTNTSGSGTFNFNGTTNFFALLTSGSTRVNAFDMTSRVAEINSIGSTKIQLTATEEINGTLSGSAILEYKGGASVAGLTATEGAEIRKVD